MGVEEEYLLVDRESGEMEPVPHAVERIVDLVRPDAEALDCVTEIEHLRTICQRGTSADRQRSAYRTAADAGADAAAAFPPGGH